MIVEYYGLYFDTETKEVLAEDGLTPVSEGEFRSFPLIPSKQGLAVFTSLLKKVKGNDFKVVTKMGIDNGKPALLCDILGGDGNGAWITDYAFGKVLEARIRHKSDSYAVALIKQDIESHQLNKGN